MQNNFLLTNNGINSLLNENRIDKVILIDMFLQLRYYRMLDPNNNLYLCTMSDGESEYDKFILRADKGLTENDVIHIKKIRIVRIVTVEEEKYINCLIYEAIKYDEYLNQLENLQKEREKKELEIKRKRIEEENERKKLEEERIKKEEEQKKKNYEEELNKKRKEEELKRKTNEEEELNKKKKEEKLKRKIKEEEELNKKRIEEELKKKEIEDELIKKQKEDEKNEFLNEELNEETRLALKEFKHIKTNQRYNFKWEKSNLIFYDLPENLSDSSKNEDEDEKGLSLELSFDSGEVIDNINNNIENNEEKQNQEERPIINIEEDNKIIDKKEENEDKKEIEDIFKDIEIKDLLKINKKAKKQSKKLQQKFELIVNLSSTNYKKPIYVKCVNKKLLNPNKKTKTLYYVFRDSDGAEIGANAYGDSNIQNFDKIIQLDGVYIISGYRVIFINQSSQINYNYSLRLISSTRIKEMPPDHVFNKIHFHFLKIDDLSFFREGCLIDTCGIIYDEGEPRLYNMKKGQFFMRNVLIGDNSMKKIWITLYEPYSKDIRLKIEKGQILAIKYGKIGITDTKIKKLSTNYNTILQNSTGNYNEDLLLKKFYEKNENINNFIFIFREEKYKYLKEIREIMDYNAENHITNFNLTFVTKAYIQNFYLDKNSIYEGCPLCSKKLNQIENGNYECVPCKHSYHQPKYLFKLNFKVRDANSNAYFKLLGIKATNLLEVEPELVHNYLEEKKYKELVEIAKKVLFKEYIFTATLKVFGKDKNGKILQSININNMEPAHGENLKRIMEIMNDEDESS